MYNTTRNNASLYQVYDENHMMTRCNATKGPTNYLVSNVVLIDNSAWWGAETDQYVVLDNTNNAQLRPPSYTILDPQLQENG